MGSEHCPCVWGPREQTLPCSRGSCPCLGSGILQGCISPGCSCWDVCNHDILKKALIWERISGGESPRLCWSPARRQSPSPPWQWEALHGNFLAEEFWFLFIFIYFISSPEILKYKPWEVSRILLWKCSGGFLFLLSLKQMWLLTSGFPQGYINMGTLCLGRFHCCI